MSVLFHVLFVLGVFAVGIYVGTTVKANAIKSELKNFELSASDEVYKVVSAVRKHL